MKVFLSKGLLWENSTCLTRREGGEKERERQSGQEGHNHPTRPKERVKAILSRSPSAPGSPTCSFNSRRHPLSHS